LLRRARLGFEKTAGRAQCSDPGHASRMFSDCHNSGPIRNAWP
jgi:hypothetical protein